MFGLFERWAALEPQRCRLGEKKISFGPNNDDDWIEWDWEFLPWRESGSVQMAVIEAIDARNWSWTRSTDGTITVGSPTALHSIIISGKNFTLDLLNAYVQRLEMEVHLLTTD